MCEEGALLASWRDSFQRPDLPFYFVQIAPYQYGEEDPEVLARFWVAQRECMRLRTRGMAIITDIAEIPDIHPAHKKRSLGRLSLWALADTYGNKAIDQVVPLYESYAVEGNAIRVKFSHAKQLKSADGAALTHFELAGEDGVFVAATATPEGASVLVRSERLQVQASSIWLEQIGPWPNLVDEDGLLPVNFIRIGQPIQS